MISIKMKTSVELDEEKVNLARSLAPQPSLRALLDASLDAYITRARRSSLANMLGTNFFEGDLDVMRERKSGGPRSRR